MRAFVLGANDGLVSVAALVLGVGGASSDLQTMRLAGVAGLVGGALSMACGEFWSWRWCGGTAQTGGQRCEQQASSCQP